MISNAIITKLEWLHQVCRMQKSVMSSHKITPCVFKLCQLIVYLHVHTNEVEFLPQINREYLKLTKCLELTDKTC